MLAGHGENCLSRGILQLLFLRAEPQSVCHDFLVEAAGPPLPVLGRPSAVGWVYDRAVNNLCRTILKHSRNDGRRQLRTHHLHTEHSTLQITQSTLLNT